MWLFLVQSGPTARLRFVRSPKFGPFVQLAKRTCLRPLTYILQTLVILPDDADASVLDIQTIVVHEGLPLMLRADLLDNCTGARKMIIAIAALAHYDVNHPALIRAGATKQLQRLMKVTYFDGHARCPTAEEHGDMLLIAKCTLERLQSSLQ